MLPLQRPNYPDTALFKGGSAPPPPKVPKQEKLKIPEPPKAPPPPAPLPAPATETSSEVAAAGERQKRDAKRRRGYMSTLLSGQTQTPGSLLG